MVSIANTYGVGVKAIRGHKRHVDTSGPKPENRGRRKRKLVQPEAPPVVLERTGDPVVDMLKDFDVLWRKCLASVEFNLANDTPAEGVRTVAQLRREIKFLLAEVDTMRAKLRPTADDVQVDAREVSELARLTPAELAVVAAKLADEAQRLAGMAQKREQDDARTLAGRKT